MVQHIYTRQIHTHHINHLQLGCGDYSSQWCLKVLPRSAGAVPNFFLSPLDWPGMFCDWWSERRDKCGPNLDTTIPTQTGDTQEREWLEVHNWGKSVVSAVPYLTRLEYTCNCCSAHWWGDTLGAYRSWRLAKVTGNIVVEPYNVGSLSKCVEQSLLTHFENT